MTCCWPVFARQRCKFGIVIAYYLFSERDWFGVRSRTLTALRKQSLPNVQQIERDCGSPEKRTTEIESVSKLKA